MKPKRKKYCNVLDVTFFNVVVLVLNTFLSAKDLVTLSLVNHLLRRVVKDRYRLLTIEWRSLKDPGSDYKNQDHIDPHRVDMATALAVRSGLDPGRIVRTLNGEYTGARRNTKQILAAVAPVVTSDDYQYIKRMLTQCCPHFLEFQEETSSKLQVIARGKQKSFTKNLPVVKKNYEERG